MSNKLDEATVRHVAGLARLNVSDDEVSLFARQLAAVLDYVDQINELNTDDVPATAHALPLVNVFREDSVDPSYKPADALSNAPDSHDGFFKVPKVLDQDGA